MTYKQPTETIEQKKMAANSDKKTTTVRFPKDLLEALDAEAAVRGWSRTSLMTQLIVKGLSELGVTTKIRVIL